MKKLVQQILLVKPQQMYKKQFEGYTSHQDCLVSQALLFEAFW